jgi:hypothetical protein
MRKSLRRFEGTKMDGMRITLTGDRELRRMFDELPAAAQNRVLRLAIRDGGKQMADAVEAAAPQESGLLKRAIGASTLRQYGGNKLFIAAGVRRGFKSAVFLGMKGKATGRLRLASKRGNTPGRIGQYQTSGERDPVKYLHLVTGGRKAVAARNVKVLYSSQTERFLGPSVAAVSPNDFVARAFESAQNSVSAAITARVESGILTEAAKFAKK